MKTGLHRSARRVTSFTGVLAVATCTLAAQSPAPSREVWQRPDDIVAALGLTPGSRVVDVGAGDGFFTVRLARAVGPSGRVLAVDVEPKMLEALKQLTQKEKLPNVDVIQGEPNDPHLEPNSVDAVLIVNAYHEMREHGAMLAHIRKALRPKGRLVIVEQITEARRDESRDVQVKAHDLAPEYVVTELHGAGFRVERLDANFTTNPATKDINWIIVATPGTRLTGPSPAPMAAR
jgi:ubiquinone/menaquinone biosynthesis C-methylase UbiE